MTDVNIVVAVLSLIAVLASGYATYRATIKSKELENEATPYSVLAERVTSLELADVAKAKRLAAIERKNRTLVDALLEQHQWQLDGAKPPPPKIHSLALAILLRQATEESNSND